MGRDMATSRPGSRATTASREQPRRSARQTERAFIEVATTLFAQKGFNGTSISDLAQELGLTTASLYYHVSSKQELLLRVLATGMSDFLHRLEGVVQGSGSSRDKLRIAIENHLEFVLGNPLAVTVFLRERRFLESPYREEYQEQVDRYDKLFSGIIAAGVRTGEMPPVDVQLTRLAILGMINWVVEWYEPGGRLDPTRIKQEMTELILDRMLAIETVPTSVVTRPSDAT